MNWQILIDFDGTVTRKDTTDLLLEHFALPEWRDIEADWVAGKIGSAECMRRQVDLLRVTPAELNAFIETIEPDWNFKSFIRMCQRLNLPVKIVSDGLDWTVRAVLRRIGLDGLTIAANHLEHAGGDRWVLTSPHAKPECRAAAGTCKCAVAAQRVAQMTVLIGAGKSDMCLAEEADLVFAKAGLLQFCRENALPHQAFETFADVSDMLARFVETGKTPAFIYEKALSLPQ